MAVINNSGAKRTPAACNRDRGPTSNAENAAMKGMYISAAPAADVKHYERAATRWKAMLSGAFVLRVFVCS
jgi:hypothetical protein